MCKTVQSTANSKQMMLQTAPVLFIYLPTVGPNAKTDGQPLRLDFTQG
jgi:oligosaccharyltransferase complex subunit gamma